MPLEWTDFLWIMSPILFVAAFFAFARWRKLDTTDNSINRNTGAGDSG